MDLTERRTTLDWALDWLRLCKGHHACVWNSRMLSVSI